MRMKKCGLNLSRAGKELQPHGTYEFPCAGYLAEYTMEPEGIIPWHWHEEMEIAYVKAGALKLQIPARTYDMKEGDCVIINANIPHSGAAAPWCELHSLVFSPILISGADHSVFARKYMLPLISSPSFGGYLLKQEGNEAVINNFINAFEALVSDEPGYEFKVRARLSSLCFYLYQQLEEEMVAGDAHLDQDNIRIRKMLDFIHINFSDKLSLKTIAGAANVGDRECLRCFQRTIQLSPMQYLLKYRIVQGASLLISDPLSSISEVSVQCGFDSPSNFTKMFKRFYLCTPREFRSQQKW